jgi:hypothetical protein
MSVATAGGNLAAGGRPHPDPNSRSSLEPPD